MVGFISFLFAVDFVELTLIAFLAKLLSDKKLVYIIYKCDGRKNENSTRIGY